MNFNDYKLTLWTCASSENEVTGNDIELIETFECDLGSINIEQGTRLFSPKTIKDDCSKYEKTIYPDFNFHIVEVCESKLVLRRTFCYSSYSPTFEIGGENPKHEDCFDFGYYTYRYKLALEKK